MAKLGEMSAQANLCLSPTSAALPTSMCAFSLFSMGCGAIILPPLVFSISFLRSVMERKPSASMWPMSPVRNHPSGVNASAVSSGLFQ